MIFVTKRRNLPIILTNVVAVKASSVPSTFGLDNHDAHHDDQTLHCTYTSISIKGHFGVLQALIPETSFQ